MRAAALTPQPKYHRPAQKEAVTGMRANEIVFRCCDLLWCCASYHSFVVCATVSHFPIWHRISCEMLVFMLLLPLSFGITWFNFHSHRSHSFVFIPINRIVFLWECIVTGFFYNSWFSPPVLSVGYVLWSFMVAMSFGMGRKRVEN